MMDYEIVEALVNRLNHLENILFTSALGFLITATVAIFTSIYALKNSSELDINPLVFFFGACIVYILLTGYYYFILTHFYATASVLIPLKTNLPDTIKIERLWNYFQLSIPFVQEETKIFFALLNAALFPFLFSSLVIVGVWIIIQKEIETMIMKYFILSIPLFLQLILFFLMIWHPFIEFINVIMEY